MQCSNLIDSCLFIWGADEWTSYFNSFLFSFLFSYFFYSSNLIIPQIENWELVLERWTGTNCNRRFFTPCLSFACVLEAPNNPSYLTHNFKARIGNSSTPLFGKRVTDLFFTQHKSDSNLWLCSLREKATRDRLRIHQPDESCQGASHRRVQPSCSEQQCFVSWKLLTVICTPKLFYVKKTPSKSMSGCST